MASDSQQQNQRPERVGVYICHCGGNISDHVDVRRVAEEVQKIPGVVVAHTNMFMCSDPGQQLIQEDIKSGKVDRVVVASCAPSLHELTFRSAIKRADMSPICTSMPTSASRSAECMQVKRRRARPRPWWPPPLPKPETLSR